MWLDILFNSFGQLRCREMYVVMDIIKSTLLWRDYEEEMRDIFCSQWKVIYDWVCDLRGLFTLKILGQYGDEWHIYIENITVEALHQYLIDLRMSIFEIDTKYFTNCTYRIAYGVSLDIALEGYPMKIIENLCVGRHKLRRSFDTDKVSNNIEQRENSIDMKVNKNTTYNDILQIVQHQPFTFVKKHGMYYTFSNILIDCEAYIKTKKCKDGTLMISYVTYELLEYKTLKKALKRTCKEKLRIVTYTGDAYGVHIHDPNYKDAFLCKNDLYGDLVNSGAKCFLQIVSYPQDKITIFNDHKSKRVSIDAFNWNTI